MKKFLLILLLLMALFSANAHSQELKVYDQLGLVRASSKVNGSGSVTLILEPPLSGNKTVSLTNTDGLASDKQFNYEGGGVYRAPAVTAGSWKIVLPDSSSVVNQVKISQ